MIDEMFPLLCKHGIARNYSIGDSSVRKFDFFSTRIGYKLSRPKLDKEKTWNTDNLTKIIHGSELSVTPFLYLINFGIAKNVSRLSYINLKTGNLSTAGIATQFKEVIFVIRIDGMEVYREIGWFFDKKMIKIRTQGGEQIEVIIYSNNGIAIGANDFFYINYEIHYEPENYIIADEKAEYNVKQVKDRNYYE